jgi:hypothetical protein
MRSANRIHDIIVPTSGNTRIGIPGIQTDAGDRRCAALWQRWQAQED